MSEGLKITVTLEPEIEDFVRAAEVERGSFGSPSDYVEDLIRELRVRDLARRKLDAELQKGIDDIEAVRYLPIDDAFAEIRARLGLKPKAR